jgi:hypothetical protein
MSIERSTLTPGAFYWVVPVPDPDADEDWERGPQPARFIDTGGENGERWHCLNVEGPCEWPMRWIGPEIQEPKP